MDQPTSFHRPRISWETRRLLLAAGLALVALWILARVRFTGDSPPEGPVQPLLGQMAARPSFSDLASEVARVHARLHPSLTIVDVTTGPTEGPAPPSHVAALRTSESLAVALLPFQHGTQPRDLDIVASDAATGLSVLNVESADGFVPLTAWTPQRPQDPRYVIATSTYSDGVSLRPVFIPALEPVTRPAWSGQLWKAASGSGLEPGSFVFTTAGDFAGLVIDDAGERVIVGGDVLDVAIDRLRDWPGVPGQLGIEVQRLSPGIASAVGATGGVVITWIDPQGAAAGALVVGDVIEEANGERLMWEHWAVRTARLAPGNVLTLRVRRRGEIREVLLVARAPTTSNLAALGLTLRAIPGVGSEVLRVAPFAAAQRAGVEPGDVITLAGETHAPTPGEIRAAFAADREAGGVLMALTRGSTHRLVVLER